MDCLRAFKRIVIFSLLIVCTALFAIPETNHTFSPQQANKTLDELSIKLSTENLNVEHLRSAIKALSAIQIKAKQCVETAQEDINEIDKLWAETTLDPENVSDLTSVQKYLKVKKDELTNRQSECQLFIIRSQEAITAYGETTKKLTTKALLKVKPTFWSKIIASMKLTQKLRETFDSELFLAHSGLKSLAKSFPLVSIGIFLLIGLLISAQLKNTFRKYIKIKKIETFGDQLKFALADVGYQYIIPFVLMLILSSGITVINVYEEQLSYLILASYGLLAYTIALALIHFFFSPFINNTSLSGLSKNISHTLISRLKILTTISTTGFIIYVLFHEQPFPIAAIDLIRTIFITLFAISLISILWLINRIPKFLQKHHVLRFFVSLVLTVCLLTIIVAEWMGYQQLVTFVLKGITFTLALLFISCLVHKIVMGILHSTTDEKLPFQETLRRQLGIKRHEIIPELMGLRIVAFIFIWGAFIIISLKIWGMSQTNFHALTMTLIDGFKIGGLTIIPSRIFSGFLFIIAMFLLIRWLSTAIEKRTGVGIDHGSQEALAAIVSYVGVAIIILVTLLIAGVNFAGLAIIAGALSVGIGFGLQNIVNNFVSGIVLLIERPIKPGDRVLIGDTEGFVKKISIRSTQIKTLQHSDLIVPNTEIISGQVTNLMLHDFYGRIMVPVGVAYGTDPELVKKTLLDVAYTHPEVVTDDSTRQPFVLFKEFGNSSLNFNLYCIIRNVNLRYVVGSELHFAVAQAFKKQHIVIAFPQQDIHIKDVSEKSLTKNNNIKTTKTRTKK